MNHIYFPVHVLRRIVNLLSTLSISNQYFPPSSRADEEPTSAWRTLRALRAAEWPWWWAPSGPWNWPKFVVLQSVANAAGFSLWSRATHSDAPGPTETRGGQPYAPEPEVRRKPDTIHRLLANPALYEPVRKPRHPIVLCHGLYGFDVRGPSSFPSLRMHYWSNVLTILRDKVGADVIVTSVPGTGSIASRSETLNRQLEDRARGREINLLAHSMGGLDCRHLITHVKPTKYAPLSLTTISTPHRGSPFMDWCAENIGIGKLREKEHLLSNSTLPTPPSTLAQQPQPPTPSSSPQKPDTPFSLSLAALPASFTTLLLSIVDSPAYFNLTTAYLATTFNPATPDDPRVKYFSVAGRMGSVSVWHPFWLPKMVLDGAEARARGQLQKDWAACARAEPGTPLWAREDAWGNDGLVTVQSARWGEFLGTMEGCDHWEMRGARGLELGVDLGLRGAPLGINLGSDGWGWGEWGKLVGAWKREERRAAAQDGPQLVSGGLAQDQDQDQEREGMSDVAFTKSSSADKLSAVFDWLSAPAKLASKGKPLSNTPRRVPGREAEAGGDKRSEVDGRRNRNELETKLDLERFYIALSRKIYDEGL